MQPLRCESLYKIAGFTLLEVLIAIVVFSIGLLGLASLQVMGLRLNHDSLLRTVATIQANDMADRMRTNVAATSLGVTSPYNNPSKSATGNPNCLGKDSSGNNANVQCTAAQMAAHDFYEWYANLGGSSATGWSPATPAALPSGTGVVCIDSTPNDGTPSNPGCDNVVAIAGKPIFAIKIWWVERVDANSPGTTHRYVMSFSL
ncbi:type IV pilus modification protein PilV [Candidatus Berkiella aquae]|uniref:Type IV pilus modification protein PilV n=1 Tax=Candidatus Berkiella aquae TaxID=295108 RepID=A0A0Q9YX44_9GAMM|nr:type IV pilus modification protein PilV [Candidatus Berkiella aquae]MCS5712493.1 type IV pilus modification protein PilV [Candidatus Berkiella aquae]